MTEDQRQEAFREFQADQLRQQTKHLSTIQQILTAFLILFVLGAGLFVVAGIASSGY